MRRTPHTKKHTIKKTPILSYFMENKSPNQKLENLLSLSLQSTTEEKESSPILEAGYTPSTKTWELIIKYNGNIEKLGSSVIKVETLINNYAIVTLPSDLIPAFANLDEVEYIEKPKRLYFE
jgi:hypothetical protein